MKKAKSRKKKNLNTDKLWKYLSLVLTVALVFLIFFDVNISLRSDGVDSNKETEKIVDQEDVLPEEGVDLQIEWGDLGLQMTEAGLIDGDAMESLYATRGGLIDEELALLYSEDNDNLVVNSDNAGYYLNLFWALGLGNQSKVLDEGEMQDYGDAGRFASTGGWSLSVGDSMDYYSQEELISLTSEQENLVEEVSKNIYRPCCNNSTYFPDCNHGMAMLGYLQLLASQDVSEDEMYALALKLNSYWFPSNYVNIAQFYQDQGISWDKVDPKEVLSANYSSASGYQDVLASIQPQSAGGGGGCSV